MTTILPEGEHIRFLISKFEQSGWSDATKVTSFSIIGNIIKHAYQTQKNSPLKVEFSSETCMQYIHAAYLSMVSTGKGLHGKPISSNVLGAKASHYNSLLKKFGLKAIPPSGRIVVTVKN